MTGEEATAAATEHALAVPVPGGELVGTEWRASAPGRAVVGLHGITANHRSSLRPSALPEAVRVAMLVLADADGALAALDHVQTPIRLVTSPLGLLAEPPGLYGGRLDALLERLPAVRARELPGTNHDTILLGAGIDVVAETIEQAAHEAAGEGMR